MGTSVEEIFTPLRPFCSALVAKPSPQILQRLCAEVEKFDPEMLQLLEEYVLFPMQLYVKNPVMPENYTIDVLNFVAKFYSKVRLTSSFILKDLITNVLLFTSSKKALSEDLKMSVCCCVTGMVKSVPGGDPDGVLKDVIFDYEFKLQVSHLVFQTLDWAENEKDSSGVVISAISTVRSLCPGAQAVDDEDFFEQFSPMLPGISSKLMKTLQNHRKSHKVAVEAIQTWTAFVGLLLRDSRTDRDPTWLGKAQDCLLHQLQVLHKSFTSHEKLSVRWAMFRLFESLVERCSLTMKGAHYLVIESLAILSVDMEDDRLSEESNRCLEKILDIKSDDHRDVVKQSHQELFAISTQLCEVGSLLLNEKELDCQLRTLHGSMHLLKKVEASSMFFYSDTYVGRLLDAILLTISLDSKVLIGSNFFNDFSNFDFVFRPELHLRLTRHEKAFKYLTTKDLWQRMTSIIKLLAASSSLAMLSDHLTTKFMEVRGGHQRFKAREIIFLLNNIVAEAGVEFGKSNIDGKINYYELLESLVELYLQPYSSRTTEVATGAETKKFSEGGSSENWSEECILIEGLGTIALAAASFGFSRHFASDYLGAVLVFVLSQTDLGNSHSAHVLFFALEDMAKGCDFSSVPEMLKENSDYLCRELAILLRTHLSVAGRRRCPHRPLHLPTLLKAVLRLSNVKESNLADVPELQDTVDSLLTQLDLSWINPDEELTTEILQVIDIFVGSFVCDNVDNTRELSGAYEKGDVQGATTQLLQDLVRTREIDVKIMRDETEALEKLCCPPEGFHSKDDAAFPEEGEEDDVGGEEKQVPEKVKFFRKIIKRTRHYISMVGRPRWQLLSLEIVAKCTALISMNRDELLPLVHEAWKPLKLLFESDNIFVVSKAFHVLRVFGEYARDFIHRRALSDVFPSVGKYIQKLQLMVKDRDMHQTMAARQSRRLLVDMVRGMWDLMALLDLDELESDKIIDIMVEFVDFSRDNDGLASCEFLPKRAMDADMLWLKLEASKLLEEGIC